MPRQNLTGRTVFALALGALAFVGCQREEPTHQVVPKVVKAPPGADPHAGLGIPPPTGGAMPAPGGMPGMDGAVPPPPVPTTGLKWTLPAGWSEAGGTGMRYATLTPPGPGRAEATVVVLSGPAGGDLSNVNRWRGQLALDPIDEAGLAAARVQKNAPGGTVDIFDFTGPGEQKSRMIAAILRKDGQSWFVKLMGDEPTVARERDAFVKLLEGLRFE